MRARPAIKGSPWVRADLAFLAALLLAAPARAQEDEAGARAHFSAGVERFDAKDYAGALAEFQAAYAAKPSPTIARNIGLTQRALGRYADACTTLDDMLASPPGPKPEVVAATRRAIAEMRAKVAFVHVSLRSMSGPAPAGVVVSVDGGPASPAHVARGLYLAPGVHDFVGHVAGYLGAEKTETVTAGQEVTVELVLTPEGSASGGAENGVVITTAGAPPAGVPPSLAPARSSAAPASPPRAARPHRAWASADLQGGATSLPVDPALIPGGAQLVPGIGFAGHFGYQVRPYLALGGGLEANVLLASAPSGTTFNVTQFGVGPHVRLMTPNRAHLFLGATGGLFLVDTTTQLPGETAAQSSEVFSGFVIGEAGMVYDFNARISLEVAGYGGVAGLDGSRKDAGGTSSAIYTESLTWRAGGRAGALFRF